MREQSSAVQGLTLEGTETVDPGVKARLTSTAAVIALVLVVGWVALRGYQFLSVPSSPPDLGPDVMEREFLALAGPTAIDCGRVEIRQDPSTATGCALNAFERKKAFFVRYDLQGIDSRVSAGLAGNAAGHVFGIEYDSMGWSDEGVRWPSVRSKDHHLITTPCPKPVKLRKTASGRLTCFPPDANAKSNIMSPNVDPY